MNGVFNVRITNRSKIYDLQIRRNITIIRGDSASGKSLLCSLIDSYSRKGINSGVNISKDRDVELLYLGSVLWKEGIQSRTNHIFFIDEEDDFYKTTEFASLIKDSDNYYVIITREDVRTLPYSIHEIYNMYTSGKYSKLVSIYPDVVYNSLQNRQLDKVITEDSNAGYYALSSILSVPVISAHGNSNVFKMIDNDRSSSIMIFVDGAAFGGYISDILDLTKYMELLIVAPESFEYILLQTELLKVPKKFYCNTLEYYDVESTKYFSYERYFTYICAHYSECGFDYSKSSDLELFKSNIFRKKFTTELNYLTDMLF